MKPLPKFMLVPIGVLYVLLTPVLAALVFALLFAGSWEPLVVCSGFFAAIMIMTAVLNRALLDGAQRILFAGMAWELIGGFGSWAGVIFGAVSFYSLIAAVFWGKSWWAFVLLLGVSAAGWRLWRLSETYKIAASFKMNLVEKGLTVAEARTAWIAHARQLLQLRGKRPR